MVYAYTQDVPIGPDMYQRCLDEIGPEPLAGSLVHVCVRLPEGGLRYIDIWESEEACARALVDECQLFLVPTVVGGGKKAIPSHVRATLELLDVRRFHNGTVHLRYRTAARQGM